MRDAREKRGTGLREREESTLDLHAFLSRRRNGSRISGSHIPRHNGKSAQATDSVTFSLPSWRRNSLILGMLAEASINAILRKIKEKLQALSNLDKKCPLSYLD